MSNIENKAYSSEKFDYFAFVIDGEVAVIQYVRINAGAEDIRAAWSSDPKIIKLTDEQKAIVQTGMMYDGVNFN
jgi:hypothetical protein